VELSILLAMLRGDHEIFNEALNFKTERIISLSVQHRVVYRLWQLARFRADLFTLSQIEGLHKKCQNTARQSLVQLVEIRRIAQAFNTAGIGYGVIKGPVLSQMLYGHEAVKESVDLDILLIQPADHAAADFELRQLGFGYSNYNPHMSRWKQRIFKAARREIFYYHKVNRCVLDLHLRPFSNTYLTRGLFADFLSEMSHADLAGIKVPAQPDDTYFLYLCYHGALHQYSRLAWLMDIRAFLQLKEQDLSYSFIVEKACKFQLIRHVQLTLHLLKECLGVSLPQPLIEVMSKSARLYLLVKYCKIIMGREEILASSFTSRIGKLLFLMLLTKGWKGRLDLCWGVILRRLVD
jgi:hypothetical protein